MKKLKALNLGKSLEREEMKNINGGKLPISDFTCYCDGYFMGYATSIEQCLLICEINGC
ncbi:hypothetical protein FCR2A7T_01580 [Flavobacterium cauense R2A-7]|uniref:Uncharacterized protein n=1 Tax=Flavobacterium cauense R2A-7 TaxID=1341154 RepID=V6S4V0_9FLAO|nr:hypothetical protein [Flavobacterium cauense]ESU21703.1 hypothetical protein FCR2A7T_01580 [Flavobacterium cauense R2A-7]TWI12849.1 hypothetical protein IP98_01323 [Flavobacterium cauense R2A-7]